MLVGGKGVLGCSSLPILRKSKIRSRTCRAPRSSFLGTHVLTSFPIRFETLVGELVGYVILVDVADVLDGCEPRDFGCA